MLICERCVDYHDIIFNASKSQLFQFSSCSNNINMKPVLRMRNGKKITYVESCKYLDNAISTGIKKLKIRNTKNDLNCRMNSLLADFSIAIVIYCMAKDKIYKLPYRTLLRFHYLTCPPQLVKILM